jgi:hypothetical protein
VTVVEVVDVTVEVEVLVVPSGFVVVVVVV